MWARFPGRPHEHATRKPFYTLCLLYALLCDAWIVWVQIGTIREAAPWAAALLSLKIAIELVFSFFLVATVLKCVEHFTQRYRPEAQRAPCDDDAEAGPPAVAVLYLCCGDVDPSALRSVAGIATGGDVAVFVHDDEGCGEPDARVVQAVRQAERETGRAIALLSRPGSEGAKPGAVNWVLERIPERYSLILLADSDSYAVSTRALPRALARFDDPSVAGIQFRNTGVHGRRRGIVIDALTEAIDVFDLFASHQARHGLMPFLGHNGVLRREALQAIGGLTPGMLSDDIDVSVQLALRGWRIEYAREVTFGETVPDSYRAFRRRAWKWAVGCTQVLRRHTWNVLTSPRLAIRQKLGFFEFCGFYVMQLMLLGYLGLAYIAIPMTLPADSLHPVAGVFAGLVVSLAILLPVLMGGCHRGWDRLRFAWRCALAYGSLGWATAHGVVEGIVRGGTEWVPTARAGTGTAVPLSAPLESAFGLLLFVVPWMYRPSLLTMPSTYLFACAFVAAPWIGWVYRRESSPISLRPLLGFGTAALVALALFGAALGAGSGSHSSEGSHGVDVKDGRIRVDGAPFAIRGIHYSPYLPGHGPMDGWPRERDVGRDFELLDRLGVNTILVHDAPVELLDRARQAGLRVIYAITVPWQSLEQPGVIDRLEGEVAATAARQAGHPALLYYLVGNEAPEWLASGSGAERVTEAIRRLARVIRREDPGALVSHANWPPSRDLSLDFLDVVSFNLYPAWPREVAVRGYATYIDEVLRPIAGDRPLVITEFGQNTLEADESRQVEVLRQCWDAIRSRTAGGVVFSFADEWWKNYDNPIPGGDYWAREYAPDDAASHDLDPEEYYGLLTSDRKPKPAFFAMAELFGHADRAADPADRAHLVFLVLFGVVLAYTVVVFWPRDPGRGHDAETRAGSSPGQRPE